jgi:hypothetical protein
MTLFRFAIFVKTYEACFAALYKIVVLFAEVLLCEVCVILEQMFLVYLYVYLLLCLLNLLNLICWKVGQFTYWPFVLYFLWSNLAVSLMLPMYPFILGFTPGNERSLPCITVQRHWADWTILTTAGPWRRGLSEFSSSSSHTWEFVYFPTLRLGVVADRRFLQSLNYASSTWLCLSSCLLTAQDWQFNSQDFCALVNLPSELIMSTCAQTSSGLIREHSGTHQHVSSSNL